MGYTPTQRYLGGGAIHIHMAGGGWGDPRLEKKTGTPLPGSGGIPPLGGTHPPSPYEVFYSPDRTYDHIRIRNPVGIRYHKGDGSKMRILFPYLTRSR